MNKDIAAGAIAGIGGLALILVLLTVGSLIGGAVIYLVWNYLIAAAFGIGTITYFQSVLASLALGIIRNLFK